MHISDSNKELLKVQSFEKTEYFILKSLAARAKNKDTKSILEDLARFSDKHYKFLKKYTGKEPQEDDLLVFIYILLAKLSGLTFCIKLIEKRESRALAVYVELAKQDKAFEELVEDEQKNEKSAAGLIDETILKYISSIVLGLNDALIELTGALAGFTLAMQNSKVIASAGLITGIAASLSMASSEFQSVRSENDKSKSAIKASVYTGITYVFISLLLIVPYFLISSYILALVVTLCFATTVIAVFSFYSSVTQEKPFYKVFVLNALIVFGVSGISYMIGYFVKVFLHIQI